MKAVIESVSFKKEYETKGGITLYSHIVKYNGKQAYYSSKKKEQNKFVAGQEAEFTEEERQGQNSTYYIIKPIYNQGQSNFGKALKREQSKYSGFAMAYAKDLVVAGKIEYEQMFVEAQLMVDWMVETDKAIQS